MNRVWHHCLHDLPRSTENSPFLFETAIPLLIFLWLLAQRQSAKCDFCVKGWVRGICMWRILWFWCFLMI